MTRSSAASRTTWAERKLKMEDGEIKNSVECRIELLTRVDAGNGDITNGSGLDDISDDKLLDCLVFWDAAGAVCATDGLHVSTVVLAASSITTFLGLQEKNKIQRLEFLFT